MQMLLKEILGLLVSFQKGLEMNRVEEMQQLLKRYINVIEKRLE